MPNSDANHTLDPENPAIESVRLLDLFTVQELQELQDLFAGATEVASLITLPDGTPVTQPSRFCNLCKMIRNTEQGKKNCIHSDQQIGHQNPKGPTVQLCLSGGLWDAGASIMVGDKHLGNWLIGQIKNEDTDESTLLAYAASLGIDQHEFLVALREVPIMKQQQFEKISQLLYTFTKTLSDKAYNNLLLKQQLLEKEKIIAQKNESDKALYENLLKQKVIFDTAPVGICISDENGQIIEANKLAEHLLGLSREEQEKRKINGIEWQIIHPDGTPMLAEEYASVRALTEKKLVSGVELGIVKENNQVTWLNVAAAPIPIEGVGVSITFNDVTEKCLIEKSLKESKERYQTLFDNSPDAYLIYTEGVFSDCNQATCKMLKADRNYVIGKRPEELSPEYQPSGIESSIAAQQKIDQGFEKGITTFEWKHIRSDGTDFDVEVSIASITLDNAPALFITWRDISERNKAYKTLHESESKYRMLTENMKDVVWTMGVDDLKFSYVSPSVYKLRGFTPEEVMAAPLTNALPSEAIKQIEKQLKLELNNYLASDKQNPQFKTNELPQPRKDGSWVWTEVVTSVVPNELTGKIEVLGVSRDIAERKKYELDLAERNNLINHLLQATDQGIYGIDLQGCCTFINNSALQQLGYTYKECIGQNMHNLIHYAHENGSRYVIEECPIFKAFTAGVGSRVQHEVFWKSDNSHFSVEYSSYPIIINDEIKGAVITFSDITERKKKELELYRTNSFLQNLLNYANAPIIVWDPDFKITRFNHAFEHLTGLVENDVVGKSIELLFPKGQEESSMALIRKTLSGERWESVEISVLNVSGEIRTVLWNSATLFDTDNTTPLATIAQGQDITDRKNAEEELRISNQELLKLNSEKDKFFSIIAHDLRSPFNSFLGLTQIMAEEIDNFTLSELQKIAFNMRNSAENLFHLLENLLEWSRLQQGLIRAYPISLNLSKLIVETVDMLVDTAQKKKLHITQNFEQSIDLISDENILKTIIRNLLSNAIKFTPINGQIMLSASKTADNKVQVSIADNGIGMTPEMLENLFKLDGQANRKGTEGEPSTGLGLIICKDLAQRLGGTLNVSSMPNKGTTFTLCL